MNILRWIKNTLLIVAVAAAVIAAHVYLDKPLYIGYGEWQASPTPLLALAALLAGVAVLALGFKLLSLILFFPSHLKRWRRGKKMTNRQEMLTEGGRTLALGDYQRALKLFGQLSKQSDPDGVFAWLAARAAAKTGDGDKHRMWLRRAAESKHADIAAAAKAKMALDGKRFMEAFDILEDASAPYGSPLLAKMYLDAARRCEKWPQAIAAAYRLQSVAYAEKWNKVADKIAISGLRKIDDIKELNSFWKNNLSVAGRKSPALMVEYIYALRRLNMIKDAEEVLERAIKSNADSSEILSIVAAMSNDKTCEEVFLAGQKNEDRNNDTEYLSAMALLAERLQLWGKARRYYQMAHSLRPDSRYEKALAELEIKMATPPAAPTTTEESSSAQ